MFKFFFKLFLLKYRNVLFNEFFKFTFSKKNEEEGKKLNKRGTQKNEEINIFLFVKVYDLKYDIFYHF